VDISPLRIEGAWVLTPRLHPDERGVFLEWFAGPAFEQAVGHPLDLRQANLSVSAAGVVRGVHFAQLPPSQAKYVTCPSGAVLDVVVDVRTGSPTYGQWETVLLDDVDRRAVYLSEGLGHAFVALTDGSVVSYLCSAPYAPGREHGINPYDAELAIEWPATGRDGRPLQHRLSDKDAAAPTLAEVAAAGLLPAYDDVLAFRRRASVPA
jgi:dTDP-4-dehydrorhamnose 3,5-epimerase